MYVDANNLYGWCMSEPLPKSDFRWLDEDEIRDIDWRNQTDDQYKGYFVECDLDYPDHLHDAHSDFPLAPERLVMQVDEMSEEQREMLNHYEMKTGFKQAKLIPNLLNKRNYMCHYRTLKFYLEHGMILRKIHSVIEFSQSRWLEVSLSATLQTLRNVKRTLLLNRFPCLTRSRTSVKSRSFEVNRRMPSGRTFTS